MKIEEVEDLVLTHLTEMMDTPMGPGEISGLVDREGEGRVVVDLGERWMGGVVVVGMVDPKAKASTLNMEAAVVEARRA